ncbi:glycosyltransferase [Lentisphaerota bacterium WC36G]|nr:glycosyltransferase [Lentisphaerae bacterium WC36]
MKVVFDFNPILQNRNYNNNAVGTKLLYNMAKNEKCPEIKLFYNQKYNEVMSALRSKLSTRFRLCPDHGNSAMRRFSWQFFNTPDLTTYTGRFDIFHSFDTFRPPIGRRPFLFSVFDLSSFMLPRLYTNSEREKLRYTINVADHIITVSDTMSLQIMELFDVPEDKITRVYLAPDSNLQNISTDKVDAAREAVAQLTKCYCDYFCVVVTPQVGKNLKNIINAFLSVKFPPSVRLVLVGQLPHDRDLMKIIVENSEQIVATGEVEDYNAIIAASRGLIYLPYYDAVALPVLNSLRLSVPVLASDIPTLHEITNDLAFFARPDDAEEIANGFRSLATDPNQVKEFKEKGFWHSLEFHWKYSIQETIDIYHELM